MYVEAAQVFKFFFNNCWTKIWQMTNYKKKGTFFMWRPPKYLTFFNKGHFIIGIVFTVSR